LATKFDSVDDYVAAQPPDVQQILEQIRATVQRVAPAAEVTISYQIPAYKLDGKYLIYVAAWKNHIAIYPIPDGDEALQADIAPHRSGKGTLKFPLAKPIPYDLIERIVGAALAERSSA